MTFIALAYGIACDARNIERFVATPTFAEATRSLTPEEHAQVTGMIRAANHKALVAWCKARTKTQPSINDLKRTARELRIPNWSRMNISQLTQEINKHARRTVATSESNPR